MGRTVEVDRHTSGAVRGTLAAACLVMLGACSVDGRSGAEAPAPTTSSVPPTATTSPVVVDPPATVAPGAAGAVGRLTWRSYLGAAVPGGAAGPRHSTAGTASGWTRSVPGAVLAAAHLAVALDARQPRVLWRSALAGAVPAEQAGAERARLTRSADAWDARLTADATAQADQPSDTDLQGRPRSIWRPQGPGGRLQRSRCPQEGRGRDDLVPQRRSVDVAVAPGVAAVGRR